MLSAEERIKKWRRDIDEAKEKLQKAQGKLERLLEQLKSDFGCSNIEEAKKSLERRQNKLESLESKLAEALEELEGEIEACPIL
jgi:prefoldin subunit 5